MKQTATERPTTTEQEPLFRGPRGIAVKILTRIEQSDAYLDRLLERELAHGGLSEPDRRLLTEIVTGVVRWQGKLDWVLTGFYHGEFSRCIPVVRNALRVALYQILMLDRIPHSAAVNESVELVKRLKGDRSAGMVNGVLRSILRKLDRITWPERRDDVARYLSIMQSHPLWLAKRWVRLFGAEEAERLMEASNRRPELSLRVNLTRTTREAVLAKLEERGIAARPGAFAPETVIVEGSFVPAHDPLVADGLVTVQDEAATLVTRLVDPVPGMRVIDLCAAPGGKATAIAERLGGEGEVIAVDKFDVKLRQVEELARRLGLSDQITTRCGDARAMELPEADAVLVDAPCSGLGVLSKKPDIRWKRSPDEIDQMGELQGELLDRAATLVRPGGVLVYSTCTIEPKENDETVERFLAHHPEFTLEPLGDLLPEEVLDGPYLRTHPHRHGIDGAFGARLRRAPL